MILEWLKLWKWSNNLNIFDINSDSNLNINDIIMINKRLQQVFTEIDAIVIIEQLLSEEILWCYQEIQLKKIN